MVEDGDFLVRGGAREERFVEYLRIELGDFVQKVG
jgi:hypothetical protein